MTDTLGPYAALDHRFTVTVDSDSLRHHLEQMLGTLRTPEAGGPPAARYELVVTGPPYRLSRDGRVAHVAADPAHVTAWLLYEVNQQALRATGGTIVHAAVASPDGRGAWLFPAASEHGKSTLVAGLVREGWTYLSDEYAAFTAEGLVRPYPRAIALDPGSWTLLERELTAPPAAVAHYWPPQRHLVAPRRADRPLPIVAIVAHRYQAGARTELRTTTVTEGLRALLSCSFTLDRRGQDDLTLLARVADLGANWQLDVGELGVACDLLTAAAATSR